MIIYEGISKTGEKIRGRFIGTKDELLIYLQQEGVILVSIKEEENNKKKKKFVPDDLFNGLEQLYYLLTSGLKLDGAIKLIIKTSADKTRAEFWEEVLKELKGGKQLSLALKDAAHKYKVSVPAFYINILSVGEEIGNITSSLKTILNDIEIKQKMKKEIKSAFSYPLFLIIMSMLTIFLVAGFILPKFSQVFSENELEKLPFISRMVLFIGMTIKENFSTIIVLLILLILSVFYAFKLQPVKDFFKNRLIQLPYFKDLFLKLELSSVFSSFSAMLKGGVEISRAVKFSSSITSHPQLKNILQDTVQELKKGRKISETWGKYSLIPPDVIALVSVAENSASLDEILSRLGQKYMENFNIMISRLLTFLEPVIIIFVGFFIAFVVIAVLLAVLSISDVF
jgi:general secretion pathway protein F